MRDVGNVGSVRVAAGVGLIEIVLATGAMVLPQGSIAVQVSVTVPPQASGVDEKVEGLDVPEIRQPSANPLV